MMWGLKFRFIEAYNLVCTKLNVRIDRIKFCTKNLCLQFKLKTLSTSIFLPPSHKHALAPQKSPGKLDFEHLQKFSPENSYFGETFSVNPLSGMQTETSAKHHLTSSSAEFCGSCNSPWLIGLPTGVSSWSSYTGCFFQKVPPRKVLSMELVPLNRIKWLSTLVPPKATRGAKNNQNQRIFTLQWCSAVVFKHYYTILLFIRLQNMWNRSFRAS